MKKRICERRLEVGREFIEWYRGEDPEDIVDVGDDHAYRMRTHTVWICGKEEQWPLTRGLARRLYDEIDNMSHSATVQPFIDEFFSIEGHAWITDEPWYDSMIKETPSSGYEQLLHGILPALVTACFERTFPGRHRCDLTMPREAGAGHWRDWHRGHGCHLDEAPRSP